MHEKLPFLAANEAIDNLLCKINNICFKINQIETNVSYKRNCRSPHSGGKRQLISALPPLTDQGQIAPVDQPDAIQEFNINHINVDAHVHELTFKGTVPKR